MSRLFCIKKVSVFEALTMGMPGLLFGIFNAVFKFIGAIFFDANALKDNFSFRMRSVKKKETASYSAFSGDSNIDVASIVIVCVDRYYYLVSKKYGVGRMVGYSRFRRERCIINRSDAPVRIKISERRRGDKYNPKQECIN